MDFEQKVADFFLEFTQGVDPYWLIKKYGWEGMLEVTHAGHVAAVNPDGTRIIRALKNVDPRNLVHAKIDQKTNPTKYPWNNPLSSAPKDSV